MTISMTAFMTKYNGKRINGYSTKGGQCVDETRQFMAECFGWSRNKIYDAVPPGNAETWFANADTKFFTKVRYKSGLIVPGYAIVVMKHGVYGHVFPAKFKSDKVKILSFDQNWSSYRRCAMEAHSYREVIGWLIRR